MELPVADQQCHQFTLAQIKSATGKFYVRNEIGTGGFGKVYKGRIKIKKRWETVAVKRLNCDHSKQGCSEFEKEMKTVSQIRHRNVVSLIGYCYEKGERVLVFEFVPNQTLAHHLRDPSFTWDQRLNALIGAGRGLQHLHTGIPGNSVVHRDVKSSNILLDLKLEAKVADFGLAKLLSLDNPESDTISDKIKGTFGYIDPFSASVGTASDVYAFGVVMLEVLCGRKALDSSLPVEEQVLSFWALKKEAHEIVARNVSGEISEACLNKCFEIAKRCLLRVPEQRPTMIQVVAALELALKANQPPAIVPEPTQEEDLNQVEFSRLLQLDAIAEEDDDDVDRAQLEIPVEGTQSAIEEVALEEEEGDLQQLDAKEEDDDDVDRAQLEIPVEDTQSAIEEVALEEEEEEIDASALSVAQLEDMTGCYSCNNWIANGLFGANVFWGTLRRTGQVVAIKRIYPNLSESEFLARVRTQSLLKHENVVELLGFCVDGRVFVSEFAARGSLHDSLHGRRDANGFWLVPNVVLPWIQRLEIAVGAAKGLCYVHEGGLVHRNIKSNNVLIFANGSAKITDLHTYIQCSCKTRHHASLLHRQPSFAHHSLQFRTIALGQAYDVYSFGVVLTELLTGLQVSDPEFLVGRQILATSTALKISGEKVLPSILDARLATSYYPSKAVEKMAAVAASCLRRRVKSRPDMSTVVKELQHALWEAGNFHQYLERQSRRIIS